MATSPVLSCILLTPDTRLLPPPPAIVGATVVSKHDGERRIFSLINPTNITVMQDGDPLILQTGEQTSESRRAVHRESWSADFVGN